jgi:VanZ family protein
MFHLPAPLARTAFWSSVTGATVLCLLPTEHLPSVLNWWDKAQHALGFGVLTCLGLLAYPAVRWRLPLGLLLFGAVIELAQAASGWRQGDWLDLLADAIGILAVIVVWHLSGHRPAHSPP